MNSHVRRYYRKFEEEETPIRLFHEVEALHEQPTLSWEEASVRLPALPRGWYELTRLGSADRVGFTRDFWMSALPYSPRLHTFLEKFFAQLDDVGVFAVKTAFDAAFTCDMVYSLRDGSCFFRGQPPALDQEIEALRRLCGDVLPPTYAAFLTIHDGFAKHSDTGILPIGRIREARRQLSALAAEQGDLFRSGERLIDPVELIPFYESFGMQSFQCFLSTWYPNQEVGNVYVSKEERVVSDVLERSSWLENMAFPSFADWLMFYLEGVES
jgi:hypothetical protein